MWTQMNVEEGTGKRQRTRQYQTMNLPGFDPANMTIKNERQRRKVLEKLPGGVRHICRISVRYLCYVYPSFACLPDICFCMWQKFMQKDLAADGDKRVLGPDGLPTEEFIDPLRLQYRDVVEVANRCISIIFGYNIVHRCQPYVRQISRNVMTWAQIACTIIDVCHMCHRYLSSIGLQHRCLPYVP